MNIIDYNKILDRHNPLECYCSTGIAEMYTEEGIVCYNCGFVCDKLYKSYSEESDEKIISISMYKDDMEGLLSEALKMGTTTSDVTINKRMKFMAYSYQDTVIFKTKKFIEEQSSYLGLTRGIVLLALSYFKKVVGNSSKEKGNIFKGLNKIAIIAACIYISCRENSKYITQQEICQKLEVPIELFEQYFHIVIKQTNTVYDYNLRDTLMSAMDKTKIPFHLRKVCLNMETAIEKLGYLNSASYYNKIVSIIAFVLIETNTVFDKALFETIHVIKWVSIQKYIKLIGKYKREIFTYIKENLKN